MLDEIFGEKNFRNEIIWAYRTGGSSKRNWSVRMNHYYHYFSMDEIRKIFSKYFRILESRTIREKGRILAFNLVFMQKL